MKTIDVDDPYYYLYFGKGERPPSYFQLELEVPELGRVVRFDSLSKVLSAGMRVGFASGPKPIIDVMNRHVSFIFQLPRRHHVDVSDPNSRPAVQIFTVHPSYRLFR